MYSHRKHPPGLKTLCMAEMLERFSYYTLSGLAVLMLTGLPEKGGFGWNSTQAISFFGFYLSLVWFAPVVGGWLADSWLGTRRAVIVGGAMLAIGQALLAVPAIAPYVTDWLGSQVLQSQLIAAKVELGKLSLTHANQEALGDAIPLYKAISFSFYGGLAMIALGNGLFKPNVTVLLGYLYGPDHGRRDEGFTLFYVAINIGAVAAALVSGTIAEAFGWTLGFAIAAAAMLSSVLLLIFAGKAIQDADAPFGKSARNIDIAASPALGSATVIYISVFAAFATLFWTAFMQPAGLLSLYTFNQIDRSIGNFTIPAPWLGSLTAFFVIVTGTTFSRSIISLRNRGWTLDTSSRFVFGLALSGIAFLLLAAVVTIFDRPSFLWLVAFYFLLTISELCISPAGNEMAARYATPATAGRIMALWMLCLAVGGLLSGLVGSAADVNRPMIALACLGIGLVISATILWLLRGLLERLVAREHGSHQRALRFKAPAASELN